MKVIKNRSYQFSLEELVKIEPYTKSLLRLEDGEAKEVARFMINKFFNRLEGGYFSTGEILEIVWDSKQNFSIGEYSRFLDLIENMLGNSQISTGKNLNDYKRSIFYLNLIQDNSVKEINEKIKMELLTDKILSEKSSALSGITSFFVQGKKSGQDLVDEFGEKEGNLLIDRIGDELIGEGIQFLEQNFMAIDSNDYVRLCNE